MRFYNVKYNVGKTKYLVSYHDGVKTHPDGSAFSDVGFFKNKKDLKKFVDELEKKGYVKN